MDGKDKVVSTYHGTDLGIIQLTVSIGVRISGTFYLFADRHLIAIVDPDTVAGSYIAFVLVYRKIGTAVGYGFALGVLAIYLNSLITFMVLASHTANRLPVIFAPGSRSCLETR